ncbi:MAG: hypothetical protein RXQ99_10135 [Acidianus sp.]|uniref:hypothetical protein n=1 Tax=Acidianus sp. TaxID=1872104 RepID=UPI00397AFFEF
MNNFLSNSYIDFYFTALECEKLLKNKNIQTLLECNERGIDIYLIKTLNELLLTINTIVANSMFAHNVTLNSTAVMSMNSSVISNPIFVPPLDNISIGTTIKSIIQKAEEILQKLPNTKQEIISELLSYAYTNSVALNTYLEREAKNIYREIRLKRKLEDVRRKNIIQQQILDKIHPIFLHKVKPGDFMDKNHFFRYWVIKKSMLKNKLSPIEYSESKNYIIQKVSYRDEHNNTSNASIIIGTDDTSGKLFVDIVDGSVDISNVDDAVRFLLEYTAEFDEYVKHLQESGTADGIVRIQGDLKMRIFDTYEKWVTERVLYTYFDELVWYLYKKKVAMRLLKKYIMSPMPIFLRNLIGQKQYLDEPKLMEDFIMDLIEYYPNIVNKFISRHISNYKLHLGRPPHPHIISISNAIRLDQREFAVTKLSKIIVKHPEHGVREIPLPNFAIVSFFI